MAAKSSRLDPLAIVILGLIFAYLVTLTVAVFSIIIYAVVGLVLRRKRLQKPSATAALKEVDSNDPELLDYFVDEIDRVVAKRNKVLARENPHYLPARRGGTGTEKRFDERYQGAKAFNMQLDDLDELIEARYEQAATHQSTLAVPLARYLQEHDRWRSVLAAKQAFPISLAAWVISFGLCEFFQPEPIQSLTAHVAKNALVSVAPLEPHLGALVASAVVQTVVMAALWLHIQDKFEPSVEVSARLHAISSYNFHLESPEET